MQGNTKQGLEWKTLQIVLSVAPDFIKRERAWYPIPTAAYAEPERFRQGPVCNSQKIVQVVELASINLA